MLFIIFGMTQIQLSGINIQSVLAFFRETNQKRDDIVVHYCMRYILGESFLFHAVFVQRRHKISQWPGHAKLYLQFSAGEY